MGVTCSVCGRSSDPSVDGDPPLAWTSDISGAGGMSWVCPACTREHVRAIEAKLDQQWW